MYLESDYIEIIKPGTRGHGKYKYRVLGQSKLSATHHTNDFEDARKWFYKCREHWESMEREKP